MSDMRAEYEQARFRNQQLITVIRRMRDVLNQIVVLAETKGDGPWIRAAIADKAREELARLRQWVGL